ncbi:MAG: bifunctional folylpolyglutamate synthase/dihydrofolate synthase [Deltaproteobacteria bacterium]|nr:bifunctional folylpolyglutamate synthase/dihydrofolate synthase [Deltaproteobacteria bacterium]
MQKEPEDMRHYQSSLAYLFGLQRFGIKLGLANITALLRHLGNPHAGLRAVHIAGSNGKGSTAAFLTSILRQAGYRVGLYTSPHLIDFAERIQVNGVPISEDRVVRLTDRIREVVGDMDKSGELWPDSSISSLPADFDPKKATLTFFEFTTAMAFVHFREERVDLAVLETGMGGRLDATNVIDPLLALISPISLEHQQYLGKTLLQVAGEKAGIIKPGRPLFTTARQPRVVALLQEKCREVQAPFYAHGRDFRGRKTGPRLMNFRGRHHRWKGFRLGLAGSHQVLNASLSLAAAEMLLEMGFLLKEEHLRNGLAETKWPGRLERVGGSPPILLDGAHNPGGTRVLKQALEEEFPRRRLILVLGIMADKEIPKMMPNLVPLADLLILTRPHMERAASLELLRKHVSPWEKPTLEIADVGGAVEKAMGEAGREDLVVVTGSLYTVGEARAYLIRKGLIEN